MDIQQKNGHIFGEATLSEPRYSKFKRQSFYLRMRDGVRLAVDVHLPTPRKQGEKLPTVLMQSRYWRGIELRAPFKWLVQVEDLNEDYRNLYQLLAGQGYALVCVDVRGTGASFGCWKYPWQEETVQDGYEVVDWIIQQAWSNGRVGGVGISYLGNTAELLLACCHPAVKATAAMFSHPDAYTDITFPGGILSKRFMEAWGELDANLDRNRIPKEEGWLARLCVKGVRPVKGHEAFLQQAIDDHCNNGSIYHMARKVKFRDEKIPDVGASMENLVVERYANKLQQSGALICGMGSWMDAGTADAVLRRFLNLDNASAGVIGAWDHGGLRNASPYLPAVRPGSPPLIKQWIEIMRLFEPYLKPGKKMAQRNGQKTLYYYTMGEEKWKETGEWPPRGMETLRWYLSKDQGLSRERQTEHGEDPFTIDFKATSGENNRWWEIGPVKGRGVMYLNRDQAAEHMLTYLTPPLEYDLEISGYPIVRLFVTSTHTDGAFFVYLEDVDERGNVYYITEGQLRALHRKVSTTSGRYRLQVPYHTFRERDAMPLVPGEPAELHFGLLPTSILIRKGHRLRLGIAGHDDGNFERIPAEGYPRISILRGPEFPSEISFPGCRR